MFVDHVRELESASVSRGIELKIHGPHLVGMLSAVASHRSVSGACPLPLPGRGRLQAFLPPQPLHPLVVHAPALPPQQAVSHPPAPADVLSGDLLETLAQLGLLDIEYLAPMALSAAVLPRHPADKASEAR